MTDPNVGNTPNDPAPGGSDPGVTLPPSGEGDGGKPPEGGEDDKDKKADEGNRTAVIPPRHEVIDLDTPLRTVPDTVVTRPGEGPALPEGASAVLDESGETDMDKGKQDENADKGGSTGSTESGGGGNKPPTGPETAQGGEDPENKAIGQISALLVAIYDKLRTTHPELVKQAERNRSLVRSLLQQCKNKDQLIKMLKLALKTGTTSSLEHLLSTLLKLTTLTDQHINDLVSILKDPVFDEAEAYLAAQQADGDVD